MSKCISKLNQFLGHKVELCNKDHSITYQYNSFNYEIDCENSLVLMDNSEPDCKTYIVLEEITRILNLTNDLSTTVVDIDYGENRISICYAEVGENNEDSRIF